MHAAADNDDRDEPGDIDVELYVNIDLDDIDEHVNEHEHVDDINVDVDFDFDDGTDEHHDNNRGNDFHVLSARGEAEIPATPLPVSVHVFSRPATV